MRDIARRDRQHLVAGVDAQPAQVVDVGGDALDRRGRPAGWRAPGCRSSRCARGSRRPASASAPAAAPPAADAGAPGAAAPRRRASVRSAAAPSIDSEVAAGSGALGVSDVQAEPDDHHRLGCGHLGEDARELPGRRRGRRWATSGPPSRPPPRRRASTTATPVSSGSQPHASLGTAPTPTPTDSAICDRGGADQVRPCLPRPAVWDSAISTAPSMSSPAAARASRSALVEPVSVTTSMRRHGPLASDERMSIASTTMTSSTKDTADHTAEPSAEHTDRHPHHRGQAGRSAQARRGDAAPGR